MSKLQSSGVSESSSLNETVEDGRQATMLHIPTSFDHFPVNTSPASAFHHPAFPTLASSGLTFPLPSASSTASPSEVTIDRSQTRHLPPLHNAIATTTTVVTTTTAASSASPEDLSPRSASPLIRIHSTPGLQTTL